tara:strand:- start:320 stop:430 length:111 start_codon:yes stop_codon:yes gene_type:complete
MNGDNALLLAKTSKNPINDKTIVTGINQNFFLAHKN